MKPLIIGIAGGTASGKTSVTAKIVERLDQSRVVIIQHDAYYRDLSSYGGASPAEINFDHPDSLETELLIQHIEALRTGTAIEQPIYNFTTHRRVPSIRIIQPK